MADSGLSTSPESNQGYIVGSVTTLAAIALVAVGIRLHSRLVGGIKFGVDDILIFAALPLAISLAVVTAIATKYGLGRHLLLVMSTLEMDLKLTFVTQILWGSATPLVKLSILSFYLRVFNRGNRFMTLAVWSLIVYTIAWMVSILIVLGIQCRPITKFWDATGTAPGTCIDTTAFYIGGSATDVAADFVMLFLPLPAIWALHMPLSKKISLLVIFMLGSLTCIISLVRLVELIQAVGNEEDFTWDSIRPTIWSVAEPCLGIVCACLPTMQPAVHKVKESIEHLSTKALSLLSTRSGSSKASQSSWNMKRDYEQFSEGASQPFGGITVTNGFEMKSSASTTTDPLGKTLVAPGV